MTFNEAALFVFAAVILIVGLYIDKHREVRPKKNRRKPRK